MGEFATSGADEGKGSGILAVCATPIGNMGDVSERVLEQLRAADVVYAEDTRVARKLLSRFGIHVRVERCDEHATNRAIPEIVERVRAGQTVAFVSDAGMPCISDPGQRVVDAVRAEGLAVTVLPGPSALTTAVAGSGLRAPSVYFGGFLPRKAGERVRLLEGLRDLDALLVFYESSHRAAASLRSIAEVFPARRVCMARELTKIHEEYLVGAAVDVADEVGSRADALKGEVVLLIEAACAGGREVAQVSDEELRERAAQLAEEEGLSASAGAKRLARELGVDRKRAYEAFC